MDFSKSGARRVSSNNGDSHTPFHQAVSAFLALVVTVWTPLTVSGGDFQSIQLVRKRSEAAEEAILAAVQ